MYQEHEKPQAADEWAASGRSLAAKLEAERDRAMVARRPAMVCGVPASCLFRKKERMADALRRFTRLEFGYRGQVPEGLRRGPFGWEPAAVRTNLRVVRWGEG